MYWNNKIAQSDASFKGMHSMQNKNYLHKLYEVNPRTGNYIVEITVDRYEYIFNDLDNAPLIKRDMNYEIKDFLHQCSTDIQIKHKIDLCFNVSKEKRNEAKEKQVTAAFKTYCSFYLHSYKKKLRDSYYQVAKYAVISFVLLALGFFIEDRLKKGLLYNILREGLSIGGWVFLWQALMFFVGERKDISSEIKILKRLLNLHIFFKYI